MLTISKPLSASQVRTYHEREFASERQNYWSRDQQGHREWQGKLARQWGLAEALGAKLVEAVRLGCAFVHTAIERSAHTFGVTTGEAR
jgi:hypothetical protein